MKKITSILRTAIFAALVYSGATLKAQTFTVSTTSVCAASISGTLTVYCGVTSTVSGAVNYSYAVFGCSNTAISNYSLYYATATIGCPNPGSYTITCTAIASNSTAISTSSQVITVLQSPTVSISGPTLICPNSTNTYTASGASSYTWGGYIPATGIYSLNGSTASMTIGTGGCYTLTGTGSNGCTNTSYLCPAVGQASVTISQNAICVGGSATLTASGASSYTWSNGSNSNSIVVSPSVTTIYSLSAAGAASCALFSTHTISVFTPPVLTLTVPATVCQGYQIMLSAGGANSYTWVNAPTYSNGISFVTPSVSTCYTVIGMSAPQCGTVSASACVSVLTTPTLVISGNFSICPNSINVYTASGASTYSWYASGYSVSATTATLNASLFNPSFFVSANSANGCYANATVTPVFYPSPTIAVSASPGATNICAGNTVMLTANGASSYTWTINGSNSNTLLATPLTSMCYSVFGSNVFGCQSNMPGTRCFNVLSPPSISVTGLNSLCSGRSATLSVSGATSYVWSNSSTGSSIVVSPSSNTCYSVTGYASNGCSNSASQCLTVMPSPALSIAGNNTVCAGSSVTFTASGAGSYVWNTAATTPTLNVMPLTSTNYTVTGSHTTNSCTSTSTIGLTVYTTCAIVWPGDANRDGLVDNTDVLELGLAAGNTGPLRSGATIAWNGEFASAWSGNGSTGWNKCHVDCNGDGVVNSGDTLAIWQNYSLTHSFRGQTFGNMDIALAESQIPVSAGNWGKLDIILGDASTQLTLIYGAVFDLNFDHTLIEKDSLKVVYSPSFLNASSQNINFRKMTFNSDKLHCASVRTDGANVSGYGKIGELYFKVKQGLSDNTPLYFSASNGQMIDKWGNSTALGSGNTVSVSVNNNLTGVSKYHAASIFRFYPNPASDMLTLENTAKVPGLYRILDIAGRLILKGDFASTKTLDVSALDAGSYLLELECTQGKSQQKLIIEK